MGVLKTNGLLRMIKHGEPVIAVGHGKDSQLIGLQPSADFQPYFSPVEFTDHPWFINGPYESFFSDLFLFPNVISYRGIPNVKTLLQQSFMHINNFHLLFFST